jgi:hypothetical protein
VPLRARFLYASDSVISPIYTQPDVDVVCVALYGAEHSSILARTRRSAVSSV